MKKEYVLFAGVNGAGKSTLYYGHLYDKKQPRVNSDEILKESGGDWKNTIEQSAAMK